MKIGVGIVFEDEYSINDFDLVYIFEELEKPKSSKKKPIYKKAFYYEPHPKIEKLKDTSKTIVDEPTVLSPKVLLLKLNEIKI